MVISDNFWFPILIIIISYIPNVIYSMIDYLEISTFSYSDVNEHCPITYHFLENALHIIIFNLNIQAIIHLPQSFSKLIDVEYLTILFPYAIAPTYFLYELIWLHCKS